jgi:hypothetical protein
MSRKFPKYYEMSSHSYQLILILILSLVTACAAETEPRAVPTATLPGLVVAEVTVELENRLEEPKVVEQIEVSPVPTATIAEVITPPPQPTPLPDIPGLIGPIDYPDDVNPLTGERVDDPAILNRRPLAVKVANTARVRPQAGLNQSDMVFEHYSEGGITRFTAIFYTHTPQRVGSIRSGRLIDLEIPVMYDAAFAYSGSSHEIKEMIWDSSFFGRVISPDFGHGGFWRTDDEKNPSEFHVDSLFTNTLDLRQILVERGQETRPVYEFGMAFHPEPPPGGAEARAVEVIYAGTGIFWEYQPGTGRYARWSDGQKHLDANSEEILSFKNIVVVKAPHIDTEIIEDTGGSPSIQIQIWGEGEAVIFRDGLRYDGFWRRENPQDMLTFYDQNGQILPLAPGNTFVELVPLNFENLASRP